VSKREQMSVSLYTENGCFTQKFHRERKRERGGERVCVCERELEKEKREKERGRERERASHFTRIMELYNALHQKVAKTALKRGRTDGGWGDEKTPNAFPERQSHLIGKGGHNDTKSEIEGQGEGDRERERGRESESESEKWREGQMER